MPKKLGILTHYYNSTNYGGVLQSYALCEYLNQNGVEAKQICYDTTKYPANLHIKHFLAFHYNQLKNICHPMAFWKILKRKKAFVHFRERIPHTNRVFSNKDIFDTNDLFDAFITGADQVWHPSVINVGYSLSFCIKPKYSYAASIASGVIPSDKIRLYDSLKSYKAVSVRERKARELLSVESQLVLDPVFLLSDEHWRHIASPKIIKEPYVFCYFLGDSLEDRISALQFGHDKNLKVVNIPYLKNCYRKCDDIPFDYSLSNVSPNDYLSLILNSEYVLTDSFHAICFSFIFHKQFFVFDRKSKTAMNTRITDILNTLSLNDRYIESSKQNLSECTDIENEGDFDQFECLKKESIFYIDSIIKELIIE